MPLHLDSKSFCSEAARTMIISEQPPVSGERWCFPSHSAIAERSYTLPSSAITGSSGRLWVMGHRNSLMASSTALLCLRSSCCVVASSASAAVRFGAIVGS